VKSLGPGLEMNCSEALTT
ncbi:hypothetical protein Tco_1250981, partial [Tanacetum coccineum]